MKKHYYTEIKNDVLDVAARLKEVDDGYFVLFNNLLKRIEIHNARQKTDTFCLAAPFNKLDARTVDMVRKTRAENADRIFAEIDAHNQKLEKEYFGV